MKWWVSQAVCLQGQDDLLVGVEVVAFGLAVELVGVVAGVVEEGLGGAGEGAAWVPDEIDVIAGAFVGEGDDARIFFADGEVFGPIDAGDVGDDVAVAEILQTADEFLAAFEDDVGLEIGFFAEDVDGAQDVFGFWRANEGGVAEAGEIHRRIAGDGAVQRGEDDVFIGAEDVAGAFFGQGAGVGDGEIDIASEKLGFEGGAGVDGVVYDDVGVGF